MSDRIVDEIGGPVPQIDPTLAKVLQYVALEGKERLKELGQLVPFTAVTVKENMFIEEMESTTSDHVFAEARHTVQNVKGADAYALCYDGYIDTDAGKKDAVIAEGGVPGEETGYAVAIVYEGEGEDRAFIDQVAYIGKAPNFMQHIDPNDKFVPADDGMELIGGSEDVAAEDDEEAGEKEE